jgi:hypothetical protein
MYLTYLPTNSQTYKCVPCQVRVIGYFTENTSVIRVDSNTNSQTYKCVPCQVRVVGYFTENTSVIRVDSSPLYTNT